jgi:hypothetical protein
MARILDPYRKTARVVLELWLVEADWLVSQTPNPADQRTIVDAARTPHKVRWPDWWSENCNPKRPCQHPLIWCVAFGATGAPVFDILILKGTNPAHIQQLCVSAW